MAVAIGMAENRWWLGGQTETPLFSWGVARHDPLWLSSFDLGGKQRAPSQEINRGFQVLQIHRDTQMCLYLYRMKNIVSLLKSFYPKCLCRELVEDVWLRILANNCKIKEWNYIKGFHIYVYIYIYSKSDWYRRIFLSFSFSHTRTHIDKHTQIHTLVSYAHFAYIRLVFSHTRSWWRIRWGGGIRGDWRESHPEDSKASCDPWWTIMGIAHTGNFTAVRVVCTDVFLKWVTYT